MPLSEPLPQDVEVTGRIRAALFAATDAPSTDWVVRLCDVDAQGISRNIADGILRVNTKPDTVRQYEIDLWCTSNLFRAGHRIRIQVTSSNFPAGTATPTPGSPPRRRPPCGRHSSASSMTAHMRRTSCCR
jgi:uncharacterized protein